MIPALTLLLACQLVGEALARLFALPVPGPVIGMALLFLGLRLRPAAALDGTPLATVAGVLLAHLSLLFVPAGTGIVRFASEADLSALFKPWNVLQIEQVSRTLENRSKVHAEWVIIARKAEA
jgi:putative effector of murein hydrolase LrgA (UPF0299 family)